MSLSHEDTSLVVGYHVFYQATRSQPQTDPPAMNDSRRKHPTITGQKSALGNPKFIKTDPSPTKTPIFKPWFQPRIDFVSCSATL